MQQKESATVRNPVLGLAAAKDLGEFLADQPELRARFTALLRELGHQADAQAERSWTQRKAPMAAYWRAIGVYARHITRTIREMSESS